MSKSVLAAASAWLVTGAVTASEPYEHRPEGRLYLAVAFGGERVMPRALHYGLRIDRGAHPSEEPARIPLMLVDFTVAGLADARVNGLSVLKTGYRVRQNEEGGVAEEAPVDAPAEAPAEEAAPAESAEAPTADAGGDAAAQVDEVATDGFFLNYNPVDWLVLAAGLAGIGAAVTHVVNSDEDASIRDADGDGIPDDQEVQPCSPQPVCELDPRLVGDDRHPLYQVWLDAGTGQMGDLGD